MRSSRTKTGAWLQELREAKGLSPDEVPHAMLRANVERRNIPSARTIRRAEMTGRMPQVRYAFGISQFYGVAVAQLWPVDQRLKAAA